MFQQGLTDTLSATEIRQSIDQTQERTKRSTAGSSAHGFSCSRRLSPLSGRNSTYRLVQISGTGSMFAFLGAVYQAFHNEKGSAFTLGTLFLVGALIVFLPQVEFIKTLGVEAKLRQT